MGRPATLLGSFEISSVLNLVLPSMSVQSPKLVISYEEIDDTYEDIPLSLVVQTVLRGSTHAQSLGVRGLPREPACSEALVYQLTQIQDLTGGIFHRVLSLLPLLSFSPRSLSDLWLVPEVCH